MGRTTGARSRTREPLPAERIKSVGLRSRDRSARVEHTSQRERAARGLFPHHAVRVGVTTGHPAKSHPSIAADVSHEQGGLARLRESWQSDRRGVSIDLLRVGMGLVWALNMIFILAPSNQFFPTFQSVALSFAPTSLGGPAVADFVAAHWFVFAWITAVLTAYLAIAFLLGLTTRLACIVGAAASIVFLGTQFFSTFQTPGGTDVGPHPLYLLIYLVLFIGGAGKYFAIDRWIWATGRARGPRLARWIATPPK